MTIAPELVFPFFALLILSSSWIGSIAQEESIKRSISARDGLPGGIFHFSFGPLGFAPKGAFQGRDDFSLWYGGIFYVENWFRVFGKFYLRISTEEMSPSQVWIHQCTIHAMVERAVAMRDGSESGPEIRSGHGQLDIGAKETTPNDRLPSQPPNDPL